MRAELLRVLEELLAESEKEGAGDITLDRFAGAVGVLAVTPEEIDALLAAVEARGVRVVAPESCGVGDGAQRLKLVIAAARRLGVELGRKPRPAEIAAAAGLTEEEVRLALRLGQVMGR